MRCEKCQKKTASVHVKKVINGKESEVHWCLECASGKIPFALNVGFPNVLASILDFQRSFDTKEEEARCSLCGFTLQDIQGRNQLGCSLCYETFYPHLQNLLRKIHGTTRHRGKIPKKGHALLRINREIEETKSRLKEAVQEEQYELAARLRDRVRELEFVKGKEGMNHGT